jgi:hypothetical protein
VSFGETYVGTRRQLRGVAESLVAGPQYRSSGTIRLAVRPDGFTAVTIPVAVHGTELVLPNDAVPLAGTVRSGRSPTPCRRMPSWPSMPKPRSGCTEATTPVVMR